MVSVLMEGFVLWAANGRECRLSLLRTGTQVTIVAAGRLLYSRIFEDGRDALEWAAKEQRAGSPQKNVLTDECEERDGRSPK